MLGRGVEESDLSSSVVVVVVVAAVGLRRGDRHYQKRLRDWVEKWEIGVLKISL